MINKFSGFKVLHHPDHVRQTLDHKSLYPVHINVDLTNFCNHKCIWCSGYFGQQDKANNIDDARLVVALRAAAARGLKAVTHIGTGDPTLHKNFVRLTGAVHDLGLEQAMFTHGGFSNDWCQHIVESFTWVRFSLDAGSVDTHNHVHGGRNSFDKIIKNLETLVATRKSPDHFSVGAQFALHQFNYQDLEKCARLMKDIGVDYISIKPVYKRGAVEIRTPKFDLEWEGVLKQIEDILPLSDAQFEVLFKPYQFEINNAPYVDDKGGNPAFERNYKRCYAVNFQWWIRNNLDVSLCEPHDKIAGNLAEQSFDSILNSEKYLAALGAINIDDCFKGCRPHALNQAMYQLENADKRDTAFASLPEPEFSIHHNFVG